EGLDRGGERDNHPTSRRRFEVDSIDEVPARGVVVERLRQGQAVLEQVASVVADYAELEPGVHPLREQGDSLHDEHHEPTAEDCEEDEVRGVVADKSHDESWRSAPGIKNAVDE